ncbi:glutaredoxin family protein [Nocardia spumae]|uniref:glutaredoxin family protein n=1 Tax=Nocardia spumae TaxID=2887190 RepID=UPI001D13533A|nr:glutaredoxin family protein [Nocardia spumae]
MTDLTPADRLVPVTVYGRPGCQQCKQTTRKLDKANVPYTYVDVDDDAVAGALVDIYAARNPGPKSLPLVVVGDVYWFGFRHERIARLADIHHTAPDISGLDQAAAQYLEGAKADA